MLTRLQAFFASQTLVARVIWAVVLPLIGYFAAYAVAQGETYQYDSSMHYSSSPFNLSVTWFIWMLYVGFVGLIEYAIWQRPTKA